MPLPPLFDSSACSVPYIPRVDLDFVQDCTILPAPPPIFDCPEVEIAFDPPPPPTTCPDIAADGSVTAADGDIPAVEITVTKSVNESGCQFQFDFDFVLPVAPCPAIDVTGNVTVTQGAAPALAIAVGPGSGSAADADCAFQFDFDFTLPAICPSISATGSVLVKIGTGGQIFIYPGSVAIEVTRIADAGSVDGSAAACDFVFDFDFTIPVVGCPEISGSVTASTTLGPSAMVDMTITRTVNSPPSACEYTFDFDFIIPVTPCPEISASAQTTTVIGGTSAAVAITVNNVVNEPPSKCAYLFDFDFTIPVAPCPVIEADAFATGAVGATAAVTVESVGECDYIFHFIFHGPAAGSGGQTSGSDSDKMAIVPIPAFAVPEGDPPPPQEYAGLICVEAPEVRFEDVMYVPLPARQGMTVRAPIDRIFVAICEPNSIRIVGVVPSVPAVVGARAVDGHVIIHRGDDYPEESGFVTLKLSGIRRGRSNVRFPRFTEEEYRKNTQFWRSWDK